MHMSEPTALLKEVPLRSGTPARSAIPVSDDAVESIKVQDGRTELLAPVIRRISRLTRGTKKTYSFAEVKTSDNLARIDDFLCKRANAARKTSRGAFYEGAAIGSFDGVLNYVDTRGSLPQIEADSGGWRKRNRRGV